MDGTVAGKGANGTALVTIGGLPGSGKTTVAKLLSEKLSLAYMNAGDIFRTLANKKGMTLEEFSVYAEQNQNVDKAIDKKILEIAKKGDAVLEGRLAGIMLQRNGIEGTKVWLDAPLKVRSERIAKRESMSFESGLSEVHERERSEWDRYFTIYRIDLNDLTIYDLIIDSSNLTPDQVAEKVLAKVGKSAG